jgi:hypothetical protein
MPRKPARPPGAVAFTIMTLIAVTTGVVFLTADYVAGAFSAVRKRLRAITKV